MAECGEWNRKGATLSDVTTAAEYSVSRDFIVKGIRTAKLVFGGTLVQELLRLDNFARPHNNATSPDYFFHFPLDFLAKKPIFFPGLSSGPGFQQRPFSHY